MVAAIAMPQRRATSAGTRIAQPCPLTIAPRQNMPMHCGHCQRCRSRICWLVAGYANLTTKETTVITVTAAIR